MNIDNMEIDSLIINDTIMEIDGKDDELEIVLLIVLKNL